MKVKFIQGFYFIITKTADYKIVQFPQMSLELPNISLILLERAP
jgi:hypothetical protein